MVSIIRLLTVTLFSFIFIACTPAEFSSMKKAENASLGDPNNNPWLTEIEKEECDDDLPNPETGHDPEKKPDPEKELEDPVVTACLATLNMYRPKVSKMDSLSFIDHAGALRVENVGELTLQNVNGSMTVWSADFVHPSSQLDGALMMNAGYVSTMRDSEGAVCLGVGNSESFINLTGAFVITGQDDRNSSGDSIEKNLINHDGATYISKVNFDLIKDSYGSMVIIDSHIESIENHEGAIRLVNSTVKNISNHKGSFKMDASSSVGN